MALTPRAKVALEAGAKVDEGAQALVILEEQPLHLRSYKQISQGWPKLWANFKGRIQSRFSVKLLGQLANSGPTL